MRLGLYRRLSRLVTRNDIDGFAAELVDRFGPLPDEVNNLLKIMEIKRTASRPASSTSTRARKAP